MLRRRKIGKTAVIMTAVFVVSLAGYVLSDAVLQQNTLQQAKPNRDGEYGQLVNWLPKSAKLAIEYRAKYLFLQNRMNRARKMDQKVNAIFTFADYIKVKDPVGSDTMLISVVTDPQYNVSRRAYKSFARLLLSKTSKRPVTMEEYHKHIAGLRWEEDIFDAWVAGQTQLNALRVPDPVYLKFFAPLLKQPKPYTNYDRFYSDVERRAKKIGENEIAARAAQIRAANRAGRRSLSQNLLRAPLEYRERYSEAQEGLAAAKTPEEKVSWMTSLATLTRDKDDEESNRLFNQLLDTPELKNAKNAYMPLSRLLLYNRSKRKISIPQYHAMLEKIQDPMQLYLAWEAGMQQLMSLKAKPKTMLEYLSPLLDREIKYQDYAGLFREIVKNAEALKDTAKAAKANAFLTRVQETFMPSLMMGDEALSNE